MVYRGLPYLKSRLDMWLASTERVYLIGKVGYINIHINTSLVAKASSDSFMTGCEQRRTVKYTSAHLIH